MPAKKKPKKKKLTLEDFALAIQKDYSDLATKTEDGFTSIRGEIAGGFRELREGMRNLNDIIVSKADLTETVRRELDASPFAKESAVKDLQERLALVEQKLGITHNRSPLS